jgi:hypothetical protein
MSTTKQEQEALPLKIKKPSYKREEDKLYKVKLNEKPKEDAIPKQETEKPVLSDNGEKKEERKENPVELQKMGSTHAEKPNVSEKEIKSPITEIKDTEKHKEEKKIEKPVEKSPSVVMPENINKLVSFMKETGGDIQDYARLNRDYSQIDDTALLKEYYKNTKPHLNNEEVDFIMEDSFAFDEEMDEEREVKKKKLAYKEEIAKATSFLEETKRKYYDEIKLKPNVTQEQKEAMEFFNKHNKDQKIAEQRRDIFNNKTKELFSDKFKGFEFKLGEKSFNYNVQDAQSLAEEQSSLTTFIKRFLNKDGEIADAGAYHKAIYAAKNIDTIANHFYEQGKADAVKDVMAKSKNINAEPRSQAGGDVFINGLKVKAISGSDSSKLKIKKKK